MRTGHDRERMGAAVHAAAARLWACNAWRGGHGDGSTVDAAYVGFASPTPRVARGVGHAWVGAAFAYDARLYHCTMPHL